MIFTYKILIAGILFLYSCEDLFLSEVDDCGIIDGDNTTCSDCLGIPNGNAELDMCGLCDNDKSNDCIQDCSGEWGGSLIYDDCNICDGNNLCLDCAGTPNGSAELDCANECNGLALEDQCGVCNGNNDCYCDDGINQKDCLGLCPEDLGYPHIYDQCGICNGDNSSCSDCEGVPNGSAELDCANECNGNAILDECNICNGNNDCVGCMILGADNYSSTHTISDDENCFIDYSLTIQPIFDNHCIGCHGTSGGINLESYSNFINSNIIQPGDSSNSILWQVIQGDNPSMPPGDMLNYEDVRKIALWIQFGALENN